MARITVGQQYQKEFDSIVELYNGGFLSEEVNIRRAEPGLIETAAHTFTLGGTQSYESASAQKFDNSGASWFSALRGQKSNDSNSAWIKLIEDVARDYRKYYSFIEFKQQKTQVQRDKERATVNKLFDQVISQLYLNLNLADTANAKEIVDIFGLSMKLEVGNGVGQNEPILCKIYFRKIRNEFVPIPKSQAHDIEDFINSAAPNEGDGTSLKLDETYGNLIDAVFAALTDCVEIKQGTNDNDFTDYVILSGETKGAQIIAEANEVVKKDTDFNKVKFMLKHLGTSDEKILNCSKVEILGISHVEWENSVFKVRQGDKEVLSVTVGVNNSVDIRCLNCRGDDAVLVDSNVIKGINSYKGVTWVLDPTRDDFGLTKESIENIKKYSVFANHLFTVDCSQSTMDGCRRTVCLSQVFAADENGEVLKCKNCHHPEVVYVDIFDADSKPKSTHTLEFAMDRLAFVDSTAEGVKLFTCPCCKNNYTQATEQKYGLCEHCANVDDTPEGKSKYRTYRKMLRPSTRIKHLFASKSCKEYHGILIFTLGKDKYIFDQLRASDNGLLKAPTKFKRR